MSAAKVKAQPPEVDGCDHCGAPFLDDNWPAFAGDQVRELTGQLMALRAHVEVAGGATDEQWAAVEKLLRELYRTIDLVQCEDAKRESGTFRRARKAER